MKLFTITCNCGNAKSYSESKIHKLLSAAHAELHPGVPEPIFVMPTQYRITQVKRDQSLSEIRRLAEECGAWQYLTRPGAGSDKVLLLPTIKRFINLKSDLEDIIENKGKELIELYEQIEKR